ncbi:MAG: bifunctional adenosylcobinamide kinase/adenosylcobinamide-phosphate guanylyltransferase [Candidatus Melainabacteria bacterium]|nr:bifunctional adenosylcobinamide kinase/adenosylcobinamide-phosphate guanylyltransferase [Candidatus Melainabacteria bacterium]
MLNSKITNDGGFKAKLARGEFEKLSNTAKTKAIGNLTLITGGARSGKSLLAEKLGRESNLPVVYLATMEEMPDDTESVMRIGLHRSRRPQTWTTIEAPYNLSAAILNLAPGKQTCIIDCLSLLVSNLLLKVNGEGTRLPEARSQVSEEIARVLSSIEKRQEINFLAVTNEVGSGIVPENPLARSYRDLLGETNQTVAGAAHSVFLMCSGLKLKLK